MAALNQWRSEVHANVNDRVQQMARLACTAVLSGLRKMDGQLGFRVLDRLGSLQTGPVSPVDPFVVFGAGCKDEQSRQAYLDGLARARRNMTPEQDKRLLQLLALGVIEDNRQNGRESSEDIVALARSSAQGAFDATPGEPGRPMPEESKSLDGDDGDRDDAEAVELTVKVKASVTYRGVARGEIHRVYARR